MIKEFNRRHNEKKRWKTWEIKGSRSATFLKEETPTEKMTDFKK